MISYFELPFIERTKLNCGEINKQDLPAEPKLCEH
jgi:hypothetical protein